MLQSLNKILILSHGSGICPLPVPPPWGFVQIFWPHHGAFATFFFEKRQMPDKCPGGGGGGCALLELTEP